MPKELALNELLTNGPRINYFIWATGTRAATMDKLSHQLLTRAAGAKNQNMVIIFCRDSSPVQCTQKGFILPTYPNLSRHLCPIEILFVINGFQERFNLGKSFMRRINFADSALASLQKTTWGGYKQFGRQFSTCDKHEKTGVHSRSPRGEKNPEVSIRKFLLNLLRLCPELIQYPKVLSRVRKPYLF